MTNRLSTVLTHRSALSVLLVFMIGMMATDGNATLITNSSIPITHEVTVQPIRTTTTDGTEIAGAFGNSSQTANIEQSVNEIWSQCGVRVKFLSMKTYANDFAFDGRPTDYSSASRPNSHLVSIINNGDSAGVGSTDATVVDAYFVEIVPGFAQLGANFVAGLARVDRGGLTVYVSDSLPTFTNGRDVVASVFAHELGHNLGLNHTSTTGVNLMDATGGTAQLTSSQCDVIFTNNGGVDGFDLLQPVPEPGSLVLLIGALSCLGFFRRVR